ncbi:MAG TPA: hypothetical protein VHI13_00320 [Candidatus Kapabacteria bacterium]|nr:hypothetical protein [Candidatus Kapabacteria bacterium]
MGTGAAGRDIFLAKPVMVFIDWAPEAIRLLRTHIDDTQEQLTHPFGLKRRLTFIDRETGRRHPGDAARRLMDAPANDHGFTERVAPWLQEKPNRERERNLAREYSTQASGLSYAGECTRNDIPQ